VHFVCIFKPVTDWGDEKVHKPVVEILKGLNLMSGINIVVE
jgi:hypothetical protein